MCLFGWQTLHENAREVLIAEGEIDCISWHQCGVSALSVPNGAKSFTWLENEFESLERFETIYLSFDMDSDGQAGITEAIDRLGRHRCRVVKLPHIDANACLQAGVTAVEMNRFLSEAETSDPAELKRASSYLQQVIEEFYPVFEEPGFLSPWTKLGTNLRFRPAELSIWSGFSGTGKTTLLNQIILTGLAAGERACIASLEIKPRKLLRRLTRQAFLAHNVFIVRRSRDKEKEIQSYQSRGIEVPYEILERPDAVLICDKNRDGEWTGRQALWFHLDSLQYLESQCSTPTLYVLRLNADEIQSDLVARSARLRRG